MLCSFGPKATQLAQLNYAIRPPALAAWTARPAPIERVRRVLAGGVAGSITHLVFMRGRAVTVVWAIPVSSISYHNKTTESTETNSANSV